jgi:hypothetical protein
MTGRALAAAAMTLLFACWLRRPSPPRLLADGDPAPTEIREACAVTERKCSRCHTIDRVIVAQVSSPQHWEVYVNRMRRMAASGISEDDVGVVLRCLVYRWENP